MAMAPKKALPTSVVRTPTNPLRLEPGETVHVGVDVHKATYHVALSSGSRGLLASWVQPARPEALIERLRPIRDQVAQVVYEAGPTGFALVRRLRAEGSPPRSSPRPSCSPRSARRPRATGSTAAGWPCSPRRGCCTRCGSPPSRRRP